MKILDRKVVFQTPWLSVVSKDVVMPGETAPAQYYSLTLRDYVAIYAETPSGKIPLIGQFRPAVETHTWELPAGLLEKNETPEECCVRELREETGLVARDVKYLGAFFSDTGRLGNRQHVFRVLCDEPPAQFTTEPGLTVRYVDRAELIQCVLRGELQLQLHLAAIFLADLSSGILVPR